MSNQPDSAIPPADAGGASQRVVVTGATGFIGRALCAALAGAGHRPVVVSRDVARAARSVPGAADHHAWPGGGEPFPVAALEGADAVVHLAGETVAGRWTAAKKRAIRASRVDGTRALVAALGACAVRPRVLVSASAIGVYGDRGEEALTEGAAPGGDFLAEVCVAWEQAARAAEALGVRVVNPRIGLVMGGGGGALEAMLTPFKLGVGGRLGSGRQWWSWIHRDDVVGLLMHALTVEISGPMNATAPAPERQRAFATALGRALRRPSFVPAPAFALRALLGEFSTELLSSSRVLPALAERTGYEFQYPGLTAALAAALRSRRGGEGAFARR
jgi:hypothetical protein